MALLKAKIIAKKIWLWSKKFWWMIVIALGGLVAFLVFLLTKNGAFVASLLDLLESKRAAHDAEMDALTEIHDTEVREKNARLEEHLKRRTEIEEEFAERGETLDKEKEAELKRIVDESYNNPERLARELAEAFGLKNG